MSIRDVLEGHLRDARLIQITPILGGPEARVFYAVPDVFAELDPGTASQNYASSAGQMRALIDNFTSGKQIVVGDRRSKLCNMKRLEPEADEVWEIRKREDPSVRLFGRFVEKDAFVITNMETVANLFLLEWIVKGFSVWPIWRREIRNCKAVWRQLFHPYPPHHGSVLDDYLSNATYQGSL